jgi:hypothetical protein
MVMFPVLDEAARLQYLQALGVTSWLPTGALVGTQVNDVLWQEEREQEQATVSLVSNEGLAPSAIVSVDAEMSPAASGYRQHLQQPQVQAAALAETLGALKASANHQHPSITQAWSPITSSESPRQPVELNQSAQDAPDTAKVIGQNPSMATNVLRLAPLHLGLSRYSNGVVVVNDIPVQEGATMSNPIQRLQTAIVNSIRFTLQDTNTQTQPEATVEFSWPLVPGPHADHSLMGAQSGLKYSLIKLLKDHSCSRMLVMGPAAIQLLKPDMALGEGANIELFDLTIQSVYSHSLHQLLAVPSLKAETWMHLQVLLKVT